MDSDDSSSCFSALVSVQQDLRAGTLFVSCTFPLVGNHDLYDGTNLNFVTCANWTERSRQSKTPITAAAAACHKRRRNKKKGGRRLGGYLETSRRQVNSQLTGVHIICRANWNNNFVSAQL